MGDGNAYIHPFLLQCFCRREAHRILEEGEIDPTFHDALTECLRPNGMMDFFILRRFYPEALHDFNFILIAFANYKEPGEDTYRFASISYGHT